MIKFRRRPPVPDTLKSEKVTRIKRRIAKKIEAGSIVKSEDFRSYWQEEDVRKTLWRHQYRKCCYCERKRELKRESDVEHYRPKAAVTEEEENNHPGYWWLAYDWTNYLFACKPCNQAHKKNHFPLLPGGSRAWGPNNDLSEEKPVLINPYDEDPEEFIDFDWHESGELLVLVKAVGRDGDGRGSKSIGLARLNRLELMEERAEIILNLRAMAAKMMAGKYLGRQVLINDAARDIERETAAKMQFAGFRRAFFRKLMLSEYISTD